eukprot:9978077-Lingulodinium_polyedra.AAC.1
MGAAREVVRHRGGPIQGVYTSKATLESMTEAAEAARRASPAASAGVAVGQGVLVHDHPDGGDRAWFGLSFNDRGADWDTFMAIGSTGPLQHCDPEMDAGVEQPVPEYARNPACNE